MAKITKATARKIKIALEKSGYHVDSSLNCQSAYGKEYISLLINKKYEEPTNIKSIAAKAGNITLDKVIVYFRTQLKRGE